VRYRTVNNLSDISYDAAVAVDFIGQDEYRDALDSLGRSLRAKGFVTPFDDAWFGLELDLLNLERLRAKTSGLFQSLPEPCHAGVDFLIGLGQTIPHLSAKAKTRLLGRLRTGLKEGLWPVQHELRVAKVLDNRGCNIYFHDLEEDGGYDFLATRNGTAFEIEAKAISAFTGWPIKPENLNKLLFEVKQHFSWNDETTIPVISLKLSSHLLPERTQLRELVSALTEVARTREPLSLPNATIRFIGVSPNMAPERLMMATRGHALMRKKIVLVNPVSPKLVLELDSDKPIQLKRKIVKTINEAAREQFSRSNPSVIWTHIHLISHGAFTELTLATGGKLGLLDGVANAALLAEKRIHVSQLVFSGGSFLKKTASAARSTFASVVYDSPACRFGTDTIFPFARRKP
jgi:hypothetical protein